MLREFQCKNHHTTEKILTTNQDEVTKQIPCPTCGEPANKVLFSRTGRPILKAGCGGFYSPSQE